MRIGIDATCWGNKRGYGRFTRELMEAVLLLDNQNQYLFFIDQETAEEVSFPQKVRRVIVRTKHSPLKAASSSGSRSLLDILAMSREVLRHKLDVFFFPAVYSYFPVFNRTKLVVTLHDAIADNHPELVFTDTRSRLFWTLKQQFAVRQAALIATVSNFSKNEIKKCFSIADSRFRIIPEAARSIFRKLDPGESSDHILEKYGIEQDGSYLLYVGGISPHKNLSNLLEAYIQLGPQVSDRWKLVLVGDYKDDPFLSAYPSLRKQVDDNHLGDRVIFCGYVPDEELVHLYNRAAMLVFPSFEEGFGLPAIEAMSCGTPVAASNCGSLPEILGDAGRYFMPHDAGSIASAIRNLLNQPEELRAMGSRGLERSREFCWQKAAEETIAIFNELGASTRHYG